MDRKIGCNGRYYLVPFRYCRKFYPRRYHLFIFKFNSKIPSYRIWSTFAYYPDAWFEKIDAAYKAGCTRFDGAIKGFGGCPMAKDDLTGNMPTEKMLSYFTANKSETNIRMTSFEAAYNEALKIFNFYH